MNALAAPPAVPAGGVSSTPVRPLRAEGAPRLGAFVAVLSCAVVVVATVTLITARPAASQDLWFFFVDATVGVVYGVVSGVVLSRRRHAVPGVLALTAVGGAVTSFAFAYLQLGFRHPGLPWYGFITSLEGIAWVPGTLALFLVVPWLVRDHRIGGTAGAGLALGVLVCVVFTVASVFDLAIPLQVLCGAAVVVGLVTAASVTWRWARGPVAERIGLGWLAIGVTIMSLSFVPLVVPAGEQLPIWSVPALHLASQAFFPAAVLVAVLRQRMWGIDLAISRAVVAGALTVGLVVLYVVVATVIADLLPGHGTGQVAAAAAVVVAVQPSRLWLERRVHRLVHGDGADPERGVRRLGRSLGSGSGDELLQGLVSGVVEALRLESAAVVVDGAVLASRGEPSSSPSVVALAHGGSAVGELLVTAPPGEALGARAQRSLDELAAVVAAGVALVQASRDLDDARERLTSVRLQERRVIRREIHDGLGPSLAGMRLGLQAARNLVGADPAAAGALLASLQDELDHRVDDVRQLSRSLLPPVLDELGLVAALDDLAQRHREGGLDLRLTRDLTPDDEARLGRERAAAAYAIVSEAVTNAVRHSGCRLCSVSVLASDGVVVVVEDDGTGLAADAVPGVGTRSMRERAQEQGGTFAIGARPDGSGTRVEAQLPWARR